MHNTRTCRLPSHRRCRLRTIGLVVALLTSPALATVSVNVARTGYRTLTRGDVVRYGQWVPVVVDVELIGEPSFTGKLRLTQYDSDGDAGYDEQIVNLTAGAGDHQRYTLYAVASAIRGQMRFAVELLNERDEIVQIMSQGLPARRATPGQQPNVCLHDDLLILSLSDRAVGPVQRLVAPDPDREFVYERAPLVTHMSPSQLPEHWIGMESIDHVVWDDARPDLLTVRQLEALVEWVRQGGSLTIAAAKTVPSIVLTPPIADVLPVELGEVVSVTDLPKLRSKYLEAEDDAGYARPVPVVATTLRSGAMELAPCDDTASPLIARHAVGLGTVTFFGMTLADFTSGPTGRADELFRSLFTMRRESGETRREPVSLFPRIVGAVSFARSAGLYLFFAGLFSVAYLLLGTLGTWWFLTRRGWRRHSWTAFAAVAVVACVISMVAVQSVRGITDKVHQLSIVDVEASNGFARATAYFGLKTSMDRRVDVWLPTDPDVPGEPDRTQCMLRPLPGSYMQADVAATFVDPTEYRMVPASAFMEGVRCRATLKRFEGRWQGPLHGRFRGEISIYKNKAVERKPDGPTPRDRNEVIDRLGKGQEAQKAAVDDWRLSQDSYVVNELGVDLTDCVLLHTVFNLEDINGKRSRYIYAYPIGDVPSDGKKVMLAPLCYTTNGSQTVYQHMQERTLAAAQRQWSGAFGGLLSSIRFGRRSDVAYAVGEERQALLLLSTIGEFDATQDATMTELMFGTATWSRDRVRQLDLRDRLQRDSVYILGFSDSPGPPRLYVRYEDGDFRKMQPEEAASRSMYRIRIPAATEGAVSDDEEVDEDRAVPR